MARKNPLFSSATLDKMKGLFGLVLSTLSTVLVVMKWFKGAEPQAESVQWDDATFIAWLVQVGDLEKQFDAGPDTADPPGVRAWAQGMQAQLAHIKAEALQRAGTAKLENPQLPQLLLLAITDARARFMQMPSIQG